MLVWDLKDYHNVTVFFFRTNGDVAPASPKKENESGQFDGVDVNTEKLNHPTANRAKPPQRRPPSGLVTPAVSRL